MKHKTNGELLKHTHNTPRFFVEHPQVSWMALIALLIWGIYSYTQMPQRKDPDVPIRVAVATCEWPGATAAQVEQLVTKPMEDTIGQNKYLHPATDADYGIDSISFAGRAMVFVKLKEGLKNTREQFSDINLRLNELQAKLPKGTGQITFQSDFGDPAALMLTVASPQADKSEVAVRAKEMQAGIIAVREAASNPRSPRASLVFAYPIGLSTTTMREIADRFRQSAESTGWLNDGRVFSGNGFTGVDGGTDWSDAQIHTFLNDFLSNRLGASSLDPDVWSPIIVRDPSQTEELLSAVAGPKYTYAQLNDFTDLLSRSLLRIPQTARVDRTGVLQQQVRLEYSQEKLAAYGIKSGELGRLLDGRNITTSAGSMESGSQNVLLNATGLYSDATSIGNTIITNTANKTPVYLRDLVHISNGYQSPPQLLNRYTVEDGAGNLHRYRAVTISVFMRSGEQIQQFGKAVDKNLQDAKAWLPRDIILARTSDQPLQVRQNIDLFMDSLYEAVGLVVVVALIGFWDLRSAALMSLSIPITLAMTFGFAHMLGIDLQQVSIASLIIALGLLVDDPVVANDAINREITYGLAPDSAAWIGPTKLATAILYATATNIIAYLPFLKLSGNTGDFLFSLPIVMTASLIASRLVSMTFVPLFAKYILKPSAKPELSLADRRSRGFYGYYQRAIDAAIQNRWKFLIGSAAVLIAGFMIASTLPQQFFPDDVQYWSNVDIWLPEGTPIATTSEAARKAETVIDKVVDDYGQTHKIKADKDGAIEGPHLLQSLTSFIGGGGPRFWYTMGPQPQQSNYAQIILRVSNKDVTPELMVPLQHALTAAIPGAQLVVNQLQISDVEFPVEVRIVSTADIKPSDEAADNKTLLAIGEQVAAIIRKTPGTAVTQVNWLNEAPQVQLSIDPDRARLAGLDNADVARAALSATDGFQVTTLRSGNKQIPVVARLEDSQRGNVADLRNIYVSGSSGQKVPLLSVAHLQTELTLQRIRRRDHFREVGVHAWTYRGVLSYDILKRAKPALDRVQKNLPPGYRMVIGGEQAKQLEGFSEMNVVLMISIAGIYAALLLQLRNAIKPLLVFAGVPFGVMGAMIGLVIMHIPFGFMAFLGVTSLIGIIVSHIIVLFDFIEEARERGESLHESLRDAGVERLRPVLITVGATIFALLPLALHGGPLWKPLCYAQMGGLAAATFITLFLVPVLYSIAVDDLKIIRWESVGEHAKEELVQS